MFKNRSKIQDNFILDQKKAALLIIDVQNHFAHRDGRAYTPYSELAIPNIFKLVQHCIDCSVPIIRTRHVNVIEDMGLMSKVYDDHIKEGEWDSEIIEELRDERLGSVIKKNSYDAFWNTTLKELLDNKKVEQLIICGGLTHLCCETTSRSAFVRGFEVYFIFDALFSNDETLHKASLANIANGFGLVSSTKDVINWMQ